MRNLTSFTCPCCGATPSHPADVEQGYCSACHWWTGDRELGPQHLADADACPARREAPLERRPFLPDWTIRPGETLAEILIDRYLGSEAAGKLTGLRPEEIEDVVHGRTAIDGRIAERLAKLGPSAQFWLNFQSNYERDLARGAKDVSKGAGA